MERGGPRVAGWRGRLRHEWIRVWTGHRLRHPLRHGAYLRRATSPLLRNREEKHPSRAQAASDRVASGSAQRKDGPVTGAAFFSSV